MVKECDFCHENVAVDIIPADAFDGYSGPDKAICQVCADKIIDAIENQFFVGEEDIKG